MFRCLDAAEAELDWADAEATAVELRSRWLEDECRRTPTVERPSVVLVLEQEAT